MTAKIRKLIKKDRLEEAASKIEKILANSPKLYDLIHQRGRLEHLKKSENSGFISYDLLTSDRNKIRSALLSMVQEIDEISSSNEEVAKELKSNSTNRKDTITQKHSGKGHNIAGDYIAGNKTTN